MSRNLATADFSLWLVKSRLAACQKPPPDCDCPGCRYTRNI